MVDDDIDQHRLRTYVALRRAMAVVAAVFLAVLMVYWWVGESHQRNSISEYFYHGNHDFPMRSLFVGALCAMGLLLIAYQGFSDKENYALNIGGGFLLGVVFFPMEETPETKSWVDKVHYASAVVFFLSIIYVSWYRSQDTVHLISGPRQKYYKNAYRVTGFVMLVVVTGTVVVSVLAREKQLAFDSRLFWAEWWGVAAFLAYWVVKTIELENTKGDKMSGSELKARLKQDGDTYPPP